MTNPEKVISEQQTAGSSTSAGDISTYAEMFSKAMSQLNAVALQQTEGLLNIAASAAEKYHSLNSSAEINKDELTGFINQMKNAAENISRINQQAPENPAAPSAPNSELVLQAVIQALNDAIHNSTNNQQQLNVIGAAILTQSAALLLSSAEKQN
ncbi:MAG TPA: RebB family R body protein [Pyrinomonadaceae bacterium]|jgi:lipopolysaccharide biosynthesis regulator YciM